MMKHLYAILLLMLMLASCGPSRHAVDVEMRHPSKSGLDLTGKIVSVVYYGDGDSMARQLTENMAKGFAEVLETDYGTGEGSVGVSSVERLSGDYSQRDSLIRLVIRTGGDVVFLLDLSLADKITSEGIPAEVSLYCYDGISKDDAVRRFTGNTVVSSSSLEQMNQDAMKIGRQIAESFVAQWKHEQYSIAYYDSLKCYEALERAERYDWEGAMDIWFGFLDSWDMLKRASAEYNIAVACYMLGDFDLAGQWLDRSDADNKIPTLSESLRKRIEARKQ